ncbi:MAG: ATP-binding protein [Candidatus Kapaibacterium sp.]
MLSEQYQITLTSVRENISRIEPFLRSIPYVHELPESVYYNALIVLTEAVNNAIIHGNACIESKEVDVVVRVDAERFVIIVTDEGEGFDPEAVPDPRRRENILKDGGRGVFLIKALSQDVRYAFTGQGMQVEMVISVPPTTPSL